MGAADITALRADGLAEGPHEDVHPALHAEMFLTAPACGSDYAGGVGFVYHGKQAVSVSQLHQPRQIHDVSVHAEDPVADNQPLSSRALPNLPLQIRHVVVPVDHGLRPGLPAPIDDAGMVQLVAVDDVPLPAQAGDDAAVGRKARVEHDCRLPALEPGQGILQSDMVDAGSSGEPGTAGACAVLHQNLCRVCFHLGFVTEIQVGVGGQHQHVPVPVPDMGALGALDYLDFAVQVLFPKGLQLPFHSFPFIHRFCSPFFRNRIFLFRIYFLMPLYRLFPFLKA